MALLPGQWRLDTAGLFAVEPRHPRSLCQRPNFLALLSSSQPPSCRSLPTLRRVGPAGELLRSRRKRFTFSLPSFALSLPLSAALLSRCARGCSASGQLGVKFQDGRQISHFTFRETNRGVASGASGNPGAGQIADAAKASATSVTASFPMSVLKAYGAAIRALDCRRSAGGRVAHHPTEDSTTCRALMPLCQAVDGSGAEGVDDQGV